MTTGRVAAAHGLFSGTRQVAPRSAPPPNTRFLGPTRVQIPNSISIGSDVFAQLTAESRYTSKRPGLPFSPLKLPLHMGVWTPSSTWFLGFTRVLKTRRHLDRFSRFAELTTVTERQTDRPTDHARPELRS